MDIAHSVFKNITNFSGIVDYVLVIKCGDKQLTYNSIEHEPGNFIQNQNLKNLKKTLDIFDKHYYNTPSPIVNDSIYDLISDYYYEHSNKTKSNKIGAPVKSQKVKIPVYMGSMDKVKLGQPVLLNFLKNYKNPKCVSSKLDGISLLIGKYKNNLVAYTRGDGIYGKDVSRFLKYIKTTKNKSLYDILYNIDDNVFIRGELIISKVDWCKFSHLGSNARNMVMGIMNRKSITTDIKICRFLGYQVISNQKLAISEQFTMIQDLEIDTPYNKIYAASEIIESNLPNILEQYKTTSKYEIDGIILQDNIYYPININKNPKYAKAFKMEKYNESGVSTVIDIEWNSVKNGNLKPVIIVEPIHLADVIIKRIYAYHANYIKVNNIGKGSLVEIIRSGDVIPKVKKVIKGSFDIDRDFPKVYKWNTNNLDIMLTDMSSNKEVLLSQLEYFVKTIGIEFCKKSTLKKMYEIGIKNVKDLIKINDIKTILRVKGLKQKASAKIFTSLKDKLSNADEGLFIAGLPVYDGVAAGRIKLIIANIPEFYRLDKDIVHDKLIEIKGFSDKIANIIVSKLDECREYIEFYKKYYGSFKIIEPVQIKTGKYSNRRFCFSGIRDTKLEDSIINEGGTISNSFDKSVTDLIVKDISKITNKIKRAQKLDINIIEYSSFL